MGVSKNRENHQNGWFRMENPIKMDDLGKHPIFGNTHMWNREGRLTCRKPKQHVALLVAFSLICRTTSRSAEV